MWMRVALVAMAGILFLGSGCPPQNTGGGTDNSNNFFVPQLWSEAGGTKRSTSFNAVNTQFALSPFRKWQATVGPVADSGPVIAPDGTIWVGNSNGEIVGINPDGTEHRRRKLDDFIDAAPAVNPHTGEIFVLAEHQNADNTISSRLYRLDGGASLLSVSPAPGDPADPHLSTTSSPKLWRNFLFERTNATLSVFDQSSLLQLDRADATTCFHIVCGETSIVADVLGCIATVGLGELAGLTCFPTYVPAHLTGLLTQPAALIIDEPEVVNPDTPTVVVISAQCATAFTFNPAISPPLSLKWSHALVPVDCDFQTVESTSPVLIGGASTPSGSVVVFSSENDSGDTPGVQVIALDPDSGEQVWSRQVDESVLSPVVSVGASSMFVLTSSKVLTLSSMGLVLDSQPLKVQSSGFGTWGAALSNNFLYVSTDAGLHSFTGSGFPSAETLTIDATVKGGSGSNSLAVAEDGTVYVATPDGTLSAYSSSGPSVQPNFVSSVVWQSPVNGSILPSAPGQDLKVNVGAAFSGTVSFSSSIDGDLCDDVAPVAGVATCTSSKVLSIGDQTFTAFATDVSHAAKSASITVHVADTAPTATITAPADNAVFAQGASVDFSASVTDPDQASFDDSKIAWSSSIDGAIGTGASFSKVLSLGTHTITATATDDHGMTGSASVTIKVVTAPVVTITSPTAGAVVEDTASVTFTAQINDPNQPTFPADHVVWTSNLDGQIGTGLSFSKKLSRGTHTVTVTATDNNGIANSNSVTVIVDARPKVSITQPKEGAILFSGQAATFSATVTDADQSTFAASAITWTSSIDGKLGNGATISAALKTNGNHTITVTARDSHGLTGTASVHVTATSPIQ